MLQIVLSHTAAWLRVRHKCLHPLLQPTPDTQHSPNQRVQRVAVGHPADQTAVGAQRDDSVASNGQVTLRCAALRAQHGVDQAKELHHALVLAQVLRVD